MASFVYVYEVWSPTIKKTMLDDRSGPSVIAKRIVLAPYARIVTGYLESPKENQS